MSSAVFHFHQDKLSDRDKEKVTFQCDSKSNEAKDRLRFVTLQTQ